MQLLKYIKRMLYPITSQYICHVKIVEGVMKNSDKSLRCLFFGSSNFINSITTSTYDGSPRVIKNSRYFIPLIGNSIKNLPSVIDLCITVVPKKYDSRFKDIFEFKSDECIGQMIDISGTLEEVKKRFHQKKRQLSNNIIQKSELTYRISHDLRDLHMFYHDMFLPLIKYKYGDSSIIESYEEMKRHFLGGFLLLVDYDGEPVSGALCVIKDNILYFRRSGVLRNDYKYIKIGAQNALYLFVIIHAKELGLRFVDTMKSTSLMNDGVYRTKREWGASVYLDIESDTSVYYFIPRYSEKIALFFENTPIIIQKNDGLNGLVGSNHGIISISDCKKDLFKKYYSPGLNNFVVITPDSGNNINIPF